MSDHQLGLWDLVYQSASFQKVCDESYSETPRKSLLFGRKHPPLVKNDIFARSRMQKEVH